ncbi:FkbM family methyltransferase [Campylobacter lari]|uniref:FkbM family methyltransferase n=1 Tax=Campylobacter lari TaxID=201 RepID=UPI002176AAFD|nr:FkbM family methyltransferase [Campylobacter lari]
MAILRNVLSVKKNNNVKAFLFFGIPILKVEKNNYAIGKDGINRVDYIKYRYLICNIVVFKFYKKKLRNSEIAKISMSNWMQKDFTFFLKNNDFYEKLKRLCENLDSESIGTVFKIIARLKSERIYFSEHELDIYDDIDNNFYPNIIEINNIYAYNGFYLPINHFEIGVFYHKHSMDLFGEKVLQKIKNKDIIDVGGYIGDSAIIFEKEFTDKFVYSFEALEENYIIMLDTLKLNDSTRVIPINLGLGCENKSENICIFGSGSSIALKDHFGSENSEKIKIITLDSYVKEKKINVGFIKVDIEGYEQEFLKGALETIKTQRPAMLISIYHKVDDFFEIKPFLEKLNLGYKFKIHKPLDYSISIETALYCYIDE